MDQARAQARAQAQKILTDAEQAGQELLERGRRTSADKTAGVMRAAEERGAQRRDEILAAAEEDCAALRRLAGDQHDTGSRAVDRGKGGRGLMGHSQNETHPADCSGPGPGRTAGGPAARGLCGGKGALPDAGRGTGLPAAGGCQGGPGQGCPGRIEGGSHRPQPHCATEGRAVYPKGTR